jgi:low temperature requirement protein LtrA
VLRERYNRRREPGMKEGRVLFGPRDPDEDHRQATPLELFYDLVSVIAIASAAAGLHHAIAADNVAEGILTFAFAFFAIWWAWMNFTWYASAYDNDGPVFRLVTFWIMAGALLLAAGIPAMFDGLGLTLPVIGYVVMRIGMVAFWLIAARSDPGHARTAIAYASGIAAVQVYWVLAFLVFPPGGFGAAAALFGLGIVLELAVPAIAERRGATPWHRHHMIERYGLLNIIVLGEVLLSGAVAFRLGASESGLDASLIELALTGLVITFAMWWLYFSREDHLATRELTDAFVWGYGHALVYGSGAAAGAGFLVLVEVLTGHAEIALRTGVLSLAIPLAIYMTGLWLVRDRMVMVGPGRHVLLPFALIVLLVACLAPASLWVIAAIAVAAAIVRSRVSCVSEVRRLGTAG